MMVVSIVEKLFLLPKSSSSRDAFPKKIDSSLHMLCYTPTTLQIVEQQKQ